MSVYPNEPGMVNPTLAQAQRLASLGFRVFPIHPVLNGKCTCESGGTCRPGKHPMIGEWQHRATTDAGWVETYWKDFPERGIGIATGRASKLLVVDIDEVGPETWALVPREHIGPIVKTARGQHRWFAYPEDGHEYRNDNRGKLGQGIDVRGEGGYVVAPGSLHAFGQRYVEVQPVTLPLPPAPEPLLERIRASTRTVAASAGPALDGVPRGQHDAFLVSLGGFLRGRWGLSEDAIRAVLGGGPLDALVDSDPSRPYTTDDLERVARSVSAYPAEQLEGGLQFVASPSGLEAQSATTLAAYTPPPWLVEGFIPESSLVHMFGAPGIGKSSIAGAIMAWMTAQGRSVLYAVVEEPPELMADRIERGGGRRDLTHYIGAPERLTFPGALDALFAYAAEIKASLIYVDSLFSHLDPMLSSYKTDDVRKAFDGIFSRCRATHASLLAAYHLTKAGSAQSNETLRAQARIALRAHRFKNDAAVELAVQKTNHKPPTGALRFQLVDHGGIGIATYIGQSHRSADEMLEDHLAQAAGAQKTKPNDAAYTAIFGDAEREQIQAMVGRGFSPNEIAKTLGGNRSKMLAKVKACLA